MDVHKPGEEGKLVGDVAVIHLPKIKEEQVRAKDGEAGRS